MAKDSFLDRHGDKVNFLIAVVLILMMALIFSLVKIYFQTYSGDVVAEVNGEKIYKTQLEDRMNSYSQFEKASEEAVLQQMIQEKLLVQKMNELGLTVSKSEVEKARRQYIESRGLDEQSFDQILRLQGMSEKEFKGMIRNNLLLEKLIQQEVMEGIEVTREETRIYYENNLDEFRLPTYYEVKQATFVNETVPEDFTDICEETENCGVFNVSQYSGLPGNLITAIENAEQGVYEIIETEFGTHVFIKLGTHRETVEPLDTVREEIENKIKNRKESEALRNYLSELRKEAAIKNYLLDEIIRNVTAERGRTPTFEEKIECIDNRSTLYGAKWDSQTQNQLTLLNNKIDYIECTGREFTQKRVCEDVGIAAYPTWVINGKKHLGFQDVNTLAGLTGCNGKL